MQFEWWRKREKENRQSGSFEIRHRTRGGARSVVTFLFWNGAQWRRRWFISWVSASISEQSALLFPNRRKASKLKLRIWTSRVFLSRFILFAFRLWIFLLDTVYIAPIDRPCLAISLLRFPFCGFLLNLPLHSSFHYCFLSFFFFFRFAIESFLRSFLIFFPIRSSLPLSFTRKKKNTMERDFIRRYLKKAIFR